MTAFSVTPDISIGAYRVWQRNRDVLLQLWKSEFVAQLLEPVFVILALGLGLGQFVELGNGQDYVAFLAPGLLAMFPMFASIFECAWGSFVKLEMQGTYKAVMATPVSMDDVITGEILWGMTRATINASYILLVAIVLTPWLHMVESPLALLVIPLALLPGVLFSAIAICFASLARAMSQFSYFFNLIVNPMFWFGGAFFPFDELPVGGRLVHPADARGEPLPGAARRAPARIDVRGSRLAPGGYCRVLLAGALRHAETAH
ncbi:MAG: ABC transporter permease [Dehalococcoidia bacterium]|nr:ABC transporter permease [Dehalococcoidia bacterium]